jgi:hypothetical protein
MNVPRIRFDDHINDSSAPQMRDRDSSSSDRKSEIVMDSLKQVSRSLDQIMDRLQSLTDEVHENKHKLDKYARTVDKMIDR